MAERHRSRGGDERLSIVNPHDFAAYRKRTLRMVGRAGAGDELGAAANRQFCVRAKLVSPTTLNYSLSTWTSHDFDPIADEFPPLPLRRRSNLVTTLNGDLPETFAAMGWSTVYESSDDVSLEKTIDKHFDSADRLCGSPLGYLAFGD